jgi:hypothetical protein
MARMGTYTREPVWLAIAALPLVVILVAWCVGRRSDEHDRRWVLIGLLAALLFGALVGLNFQVITGFDAQHSHFINRVLQPLGFFFVLVAVFAWITESRWQGFQRLAIQLAVLTAVVLTGLAVYRQVRVGITTAPLHRVSSSRMATMTWIREHLPTEAVVGSSDDRFFMLIPVVTGNWNFVPIATRSMATKQEILMRYLLVAKMEGKQWDQVLADLTRERAPETLTSVITNIMIGENRIPIETRALAESLWNNLNLDRDLATRKLDYLIVEASRPVEAIRIRPVKTVYSNREWRVLDVRGMQTVPSEGAR